MVCIEDVKALEHWQSVGFKARAAPSAQRLSMRELEHCRRACIRLKEREDEVDVAMWLYHISHYAFHSTRSPAAVGRMLTLQHVR